MLGLKMGLRACDVARLKLSDISWDDDGTVSIVQKKTGQRLKLPLPIQTGNSLWRYVNMGRPKHSKSPYVFVRHCAPYCGMSTASMRQALHVSTAFACEDAAGGFHIARRTFASKLLVSGNSAEIIATGLGQRRTQSAERYLATDAEHMRMCAIGLQGIEYSGALL
jgi:integrase